MTVKPTSLPEWATDTNYDAPGKIYNATPTKVTPTSGRKETGHEPSGKAPAQQLNWWQNLVYLWLAWITTRAHFEEAWRAANVSATVPAPGWTATIVSASTGTVTMPGATFKERYLNVVLPMAGGTPTYTVTPEWIALLHDDQVIEWEEKIGTTGNGAGTGLGRNYDIGVQLRHAGAGDEFAIFRIVAAAGNWRAILIDSAGTANVDTTVAWAADTVFTLKMRIEGANIAGLASGQHRVTWFIDGAQVSQQTIVPTDSPDQIRYYFKSYSTDSGQGDPNGIKLGRLAFDFAGE